MRLHSSISWFAASLIAFAPLQAAYAQGMESYSVRQRERPEYDAVGRDVGAFHLDASVGLDAGTTDNVFASETNAQSDTILAASPELRLESNWSRHQLVAELGGRLESHSDFSNEDVNTSHGRLAGRVDIGSRSNVTAAAGFAHEKEPRNDPDSPVGGDPVEYDFSTFELGASHTFNRIRLSARAAQETYEYDGLQNFRDLDETSLTGRVDYEISDRLGLLASYTADDRQYDNTPALNADGGTVLVGATFNLTDLLVGEVSAGQFDREYDNGASLDGLAVDGHLEWYVTGLTTLSFDASRRAEDASAVAGAQPYTESEYGARVDHELRRNIILTAAVQAGTREYDGIDRDDEYTSAEIGGDYLMNRNVAVRARYNFTDVQSDGVSRYRDFQENAFTIGVKFAL